MTPIILIYGEFRRKLSNVSCADDEFRFLALSPARIDPHTSRSPKAIDRDIKPITLAACGACRRRAPCVRTSFIELRTLPPRGRRVVALFMSHSKRKSPHLQETLIRRGWGSCDPGSRLRVCATAGALRGRHVRNSAADRPIGVEARRFRRRCVCVRPGNADQCSLAARDRNNMPRS